MILFLITAIAVEGLTELITSSDISDLVFKNRLRHSLHELQVNDVRNIKRHVLSFFNKVTSCGYCCSVWVSMLAAMTYSGRLFDLYVINVIVLHRLSNYIHSGFELLRRGRVNTHDINLRLEDARNEYDQGSNER